MQAYYTRAILAEAIMAYVSMQLFIPKNVSILDMCAGSGRLAIPLLKLHSLKAKKSSIKDASRHITLIDTDGEALLEAKKGVKDISDVCEAFSMSVEEWASTFPSQNDHNLIICNPPFGPRMGRSALGEQLRDMHLPEIEYFERYFLTVAAGLNKRDSNAMLIFLIPDNFWLGSEGLVTGQYLENLGWVPVVRTLPIDGYEHSKVKTCLWIFNRPHQYGSKLMRWSDQIKRLLDNAPPLIVDPEYVTIKDAYQRDLTGWTCASLKKGAQFTSHCVDLVVLQEKNLEPSYQYMWTPSPKPIGDLWLRQGVMYQLDYLGWVPAQTKGFVDGLAANDHFQIAQDAFKLMKQGAVNTAAHFMSLVDVKALQELYGKLSNASFLKILPSAKADSDALLKDLSKIGKIHIKDFQGKMNWGDTLSLEGVLQTDSYIYTRESLKVSDIAQMYLEGVLLSQDLQNKLNEAIVHQIIPDTMLELRSAWIPKPLIASYLRLNYDEKEGLYAHSRHATVEAYRMVPWLNYSQGRGGRIRDGDEDRYQELNLIFVRDMHAWHDEESAYVRKRVHCHWFVYNAKKALLHPKATQEGVHTNQAARPLHWWQTQDIPFALKGEAFVCWDVGLGKTAGALAAGMEHVGQVLIAVPKSVLTKWLCEMQRFYPQASVGVLGYEKTRKGTWVPKYKDLIAHTQKYFFDSPTKFILTTHQVIARLEVSDAIKQSYDVERAIAAVQGTGQRAKKYREAAITRAAALNFRQGGELTYTDLPLAQMLFIIDEAHAFKSLETMPSSGWGDQLIQAGSCGQSKRSRDMYMKMDLLRKQGGLTLALTATPVMNSVVEIFNMLSIFAPSTLRARGITTPAQFIDTYCVRQAITTLSVKGEVLQGQTISGFRNLHDLKALFDECMITRTASDVDLPVPEGREHIIKITPTPKLSRFIREQQQQIDDRIEANTKRDQDPGQDDHIFTIISRIDSAAIHPPLVDIHDEHPKADALLDRVLPLYKEGKGQIIFSDRIESHSGLVKIMAAAGIDPKHIACINGEDTASASDRLKVQDRFNEGEVKIVIGGKMASEGIDLQKQCSAIHFLTIAWEDQTMHQRKGRGLRQGNDADLVDIYYYLLESSTDIYRFATCQNKSHWWTALRSAHTDHITASVFHDPMDVDMIASLSAKPEKMLELLQGARLAGEIHSHMKKVQRYAYPIFKIMLDVDGDVQRRLIDKMVTTLRDLEHIPGSVIDLLLEGLDRVTAMLRERGYNHLSDNYQIRNFRDLIPRGNMSYHEYYKIPGSLSELCRLTCHEDTGEVRLCHDARAYFKAHKDQRRYVSVEHLPLVEDHMNLSA
jgi:hypothetical protein